MGVAKKTPKLRFTEFIDEWNTIKIGKITNSIVPGRNKPKEFGGNIPWVTTPEIEGIAIPSELQRHYVSRASLKTAGGKTIPKNAIVMSAVGELGIVAITNCEVALNQQLHAFIVNNDHNIKYLSYCLFKKKSYMNRIAATTTVPYLNKSACESIPVPLASIEEQTKIAGFLTVVDERIEMIEKKIDLSKKYKKGLTQQLFPAADETNPVLRFKKDNGSDFPDWVDSKLGEISTFHDEKRIPIESSVRNKRKGRYPYYGASGIIDYVDDYIFDGEYVLLGEDGANIVMRTSPLAFIVKGKIWVNNHAHIIEADGSNYFLATVLEKIRYDAYNTVHFLDSLFKQKGINTILDCAAGTGMPALQLRNIGYAVDCSDNDPMMIARFKENAHALNVSGQCDEVDWLDVGADSTQYDYVMCTGNSLVYANTWTGDTEVASARLMRQYIQRFARAVKPGGYIHIDAPWRITLPAQQNTAHPGSDAESFTIVKDGSCHDFVVAEEVMDLHDKRQWDVSIAADQEHVNTADAYNFTRYSAHFTIYDFIPFLREAGFTDLKPVSVPGIRESFATIIARKPQ